MPGGTTNRPQDTADRGGRPASGPVSAAEHRLARRDPGSLEREVFSALAAADRPLSAGDVQDALAAPVSYSTVTTVLGRLQRKAMITRSKDGRGFVYRAVADETRLLADRMHADLRSSGNRRAVLQRFISELDDDEATSLRSILDQLDRP